jgi:RNA polymerase sigma factor (sigma-70 family)
MNQSTNGNNGQATVYVVDDDQAMRDGLSFLMKSAGLSARCFDSAQSFLDAFKPSMRGCVLLDVRMPGMNGLQLQELLRSRQITIPVIILTAYADVPMAVRAMRAGAFDFFEKPFDDTKLIDRIRQAMDSVRRAEYEDERVRQIEQCMAKLTPREREVMELVVTGALNKEIADMLNISVKTVENHRARVMEKMEAEYLADLVRMAMRVGIE